jgi:predicted permease
MDPLTLWDQFAQDARYAARSMAKNRLFTAMAVVSLGLGIGANTAIYSFTEAILLRSLPVGDPGRLVVFNWRSKDFPAVAHSFSGSNRKEPDTGMISNTLPYAAMELFRRDAMCASVLAFTNAGRLNVTVSGRTELGNTQVVTGEFFRGLQLAPAAGRLLDENDDRSVAPVAVLSHAFAEKMFGGAEKAVGQAIQVNGKPFTVAGIAPPAFYGVNSATTQDLYVPMRSLALIRVRSSADFDQRFTDPNWYWVQMMARLQPGVTVAQAQAALAGAFHTFEEASAKTAKEKADLPALLIMEGATGLDQLRFRYAKPLYILMTLVAFILAIACANMANLLLARSAARRREMAVRLSLGAGRARVVRQLLTESVLLAAAGGALGVLFAGWGIQLLTSIIGNGRENFTLRAGLNWNVLAATLALSLVTGLLFGLAPALQATRVDLARSLKQARAGGDERRRGWLRFPAGQLLVSVQIATSLLLLIAAGLFVRTLANLNAIELGFPRERLLVFNVNARQAGYRDQALTRFYDTLRARLAVVPGVRSATSSSNLLVSGSVSIGPIFVPGVVPPAKNDTARVSVGASFFSTMGIPILLGREIEERDQTSAGQVAVVNEVFAKKYFSGENPLGRRFAVEGKVANIEIIGVSKAVRHQSLTQEIPPAVYLSYGQDTANLFGMNYEVRTAGDPLALAETVRKVVRDADSRIPVADIDTQERVINETIGQQRTFAALSSGFAVLAVLIACVGLYGTMAYSVARRTSEIGIRMSLGAQRARVVRMVLRDVILLAGAGLAVGLPVALSLSRVVQSWMFGMKAADPLVMAAAPAVLLAAALAAGYGPARRASRIDPWTALRHE